MIISKIYIPVTNSQRKRSVFPILVFRQLKWSVWLKSYCEVPYLKYSRREKCPYSEFFWSVFSRIRIDYEQIFRIFPYSIQMRENMDQENSEYDHFSRSDWR